MSVEEDAGDRAKRAVDQQQSLLPPLWRTLDRTVLALTSGGALYTVHIPTSTAAPTVKKVRTSTWQNFDFLVAEKCGTQSTLLTR